MAYEIVIHDCANCQYDEPTRSCNWSAEGVGVDNKFATELDAETAIPDVMEMFSDADPDYFRVRVIGERYPA